VLNYYAPDAEQDWTWVSPGAVLVTVLWVAGEELPLLTCRNLPSRH
jgi:uncharacterized BrkB/YihY/UPF0761 family membrane protein